MKNCGPTPKVVQIHAKSILNKSGIQGVDFAINPYTGCTHNCMYCYASFMKRFTGHTEPWGSFVDAKVNAAEILLKELKRPKSGSISISTVTDAYQPVEKKLMITRRILEILALQGDFEISILTKSDLVLRDMDILLRMSKVDVGFTIATPDDGLARIFEPGAPSPSRRIEAMRKLSKAGISTWVFLGPVLPYFFDSEKSLEKLMEEVKLAGASGVIVDKLNTYPAAMARLRTAIRRNIPYALPNFERALAGKNQYVVKLRERVESLASRMEIKAEILF